MAEKEDRYLAECRSSGICPYCHNALIARVGSGSLREGVFCSLTCFAEWNSATMIRRHQIRMQRAAKDA
jgi:hypothetical protein